MLKRYLEKLISFGCSLQDVPRVDVVYEMPEGQNYHLVKSKILICVIYRIKTLLSGLYKYETTS